MVELEIIKNGTSTKVKYGHWYVESQGEVSERKLEKMIAVVKEKVAQDGATDNSTVHSPT